jgi:hypothetical protein
MATLPANASCVILAYAQVSGRTMLQPDIISYPNPGGFVDSFISCYLLRLQ